MSDCKRGDVVLIGFVFSDESGKKLRPALVVSSGPYGQARQELIVAAITGNVRRLLFGDHLVADWKAAGLLFPSVVTGILRTVKRGMIERKLGSMRTGDLQAVDRELSRCLAL